MCGIYGILSPKDIGDVESHRDRLAHRGPDDAGTWINSRRTVAMAHRRLSIIDLSAESHQPFVSADERRVIVFNGEVYNYLEIRSELEGLGHRFRSSGDTEVVLAAYHEWGPSCLDRFNGMFAFAIYDQGGNDTSEQLFIARDRAGKKPFYYRHAGDEFEFASELKAMEAADGIDIQALNHYLALGYVPYDLCLARGVHKLPPGHAAVFEPGNGSFRQWRYWQPPEFFAEGDIALEDLAEESWQLLKDSVALRLRSDVPVGVFLSGGLDSSLVTAAAAEISSQPVSTFTISVPGSSLDESAHAGIIADHFGTRHHVLELPEPSLNVLHDLAPFVDEPLADSSILPTFLVSKLTVRHVKVALGGDGGDEIYGGYRHYQRVLQDMARWGWVPNMIFRGVGQLAAYLPAGVRGRNRLASLRRGPAQSHAWGTPYFDVELRRKILHPDMVHALGSELDRPEQSILERMGRSSDLVAALTRADFNSVLPDDFLVKVDRASMANSLEVRSPFLDHRVVEHAFRRISSASKVSSSERRRVQNRMAQRHLPKDFILNRKQGFSIPMDAWMRSGDVHRHLAGLSSNIVNMHEVASLEAGLMAGRANGARLFSLLMLEIGMKNTGLV